MNKKTHIIYLTITLFSILSVATVLPVVSQSTDQIGGYQKDFSLISKTKIENQIKKGKIISVDAKEIFTTNYLFNLVNKLSSQINSGQLSTNNYDFSPFLKLDDNINITIWGILSVITTFIIAFIFGLTAVTFPQLLPVFVKYFEIVLAATISGAIVDVFVYLFQQNYEMINSYIESIIENQNISASIIKIITEMAVISTIPGVRGGIAALSGVGTAFLFLKLWDLYQIIQMIGGGLFFSFPVTIPVIIYVIYVDMILNRTTYLI